MSGEVGQVRIGGIMLLVFASTLLAESITTLDYSKVKVKEGDIKYFRFYAKRGSITYLCVEEVQQKDMAVYLLNRDDWEDLKAGADPKKLSLLFY
ncbi:MAG: hypothetical protein DRQ06_04575, partial [Candidatus Hydrothermota bacterium]